MRTCYERLGNIYIGPDLNRRGADAHREQAPAPPPGKERPPRPGYRSRSTDRGHAPPLGAGNADTFIAADQRSPAVGPRSAHLYDRCCRLAAPRKSARASSRRPGPSGVRAARRLAGGAGTCPKCAADCGQEGLSRRRHCLHRRVTRRRDDASYLVGLAHRPLRLRSRSRLPLPASGVRHCLVVLSQWPPTAIPEAPSGAIRSAPTLVPGECGEGAVWVAAATTAAGGVRPLDFCVGCPALSPLARLVLLHRLLAASTRPRGFALERGSPRAAGAGSTLGRYPFVKSKTVVLAGGVGRNSCRACLRVREHAHDVGVALRTGARRP